MGRRLSLGLCLTLLAWLVMTGEASAGNIVNLSAPTSFQLPINPGDVAVGNFNFDVDKDPDLAIASDASDVVTIKVGGAGGSFSTATTVPMATGARATAVAVGEFNLDGDSDLAVANHGGDTVSIATGGTGAAFSSPTTYSVGNFPVDVAVGDFDGDADPDLAVANQGADTVSILLGQVAAQFRALTPIPVGDGPAGVVDGPNSIAVGDFNGDLDPDLVVTNKDSDRVSILTGGTGGSFSAPTNIAVGDFPVGVAAGDFNGDLDLDLAVTNLNSSTVSILVGGIGASFSGPTTLAAGARAVAVGDFNRDGDPDLAVGGNAGNNLSILVGGIGASFGSPQIFPAGGVVESVAVGDFDAEGRPDIAVANYFNAQGSTLLNTSDLTAPNTTLGAPLPPALGNDSTPTFNFSSSEPTGATFECRVYSGTPPAFSACTSPHTTAALADGSYTFEVRARDAAGNIDPNPASHSFTVDTVSPTTTIDTGPSGSTNDSTPTFTFSSNDAGATFQCRVDTGAFTACASPHTTAALADGAHTFEVRARDAAGNVDLTPASRALTVDAAAPDTTIDTGPSGPVNDSTPTFAFSSSEAGSTFECRLDGGKFAPCTSPHTTAALTDGPHTFDVRAIDPAGNVDPSAATRSFTVDTTAPQTTITSGPSGLTNDSTPTFEFSSSDGGSTFECRVDSAAFAACTSPHTTAALTDGAHTLQVRAIDAGGNPDSTPESRSFTVDTARQTFTVRAAAPPPPVLGRRFNVEPVSGRVFVSLAPGVARAAQSVPGLKGRRFIPLEEARQIPIGSLLDTRSGTVRVVSAQNTRGKTQASNFLGGVFQVLQSRKARAKGLTELRLKGSSFRGCRVSGKRSTVQSARLRRRVVRRLRGTGRGRFRTRGRHSSATVRGTDWTVTDRCDGTLTKVKRGKVAVRDFRRKKTILLTRGKSYFARAR